MRKPVKIAENIYWVGAIDRNLRSFHGYSTHRGSTYNAYLVMDERITLIDTVKAPFAEEMLERISKVCDPSKIEVIISNHAEGDHSGSIPAVLSIAKNAEVYTAAPAGERALRAMYHSEMNLKGVKTGDKLVTGKFEFSFYQTPMVHWPDNMVTFCASNGILFSNDAFGQHYATESRFDDEVPFDELVYETKKYFANIVLPYSGQARKALDAVSGLKIKMIAPSHGIIWRSKIADLFALYDNISGSPSNKDAIIVYGTMWHSTEKIAEAVAEGFKAVGWSPKIYNLDVSDKSDIMTEIMECGAVAVGSSTLNNQILPPVAAFLCYLKGLAPKGKKFVAFGSYGWSGKSAETVYDELAGAGLAAVCPPQKVQNVPTEADLNSITAAVAEGLK